MLKYPTKKLSEITSLEKGKMVPNSPLNEGETSPYIVIEDLRSGKYSRFTTDIGGTICEPTDLLIVWDGANAGTVGGGLRGFVGSTIVKISPNQQEVDPQFLRFFLSSRFEDFNKSTHGAAVPHLNKDYVLNYEIPVPPLSIQQKIVERLDAIRKAQELNEKQISLTDELFQSLLHRELKPRKDWGVKELKDATNILMGQSPPSKTYNTKGEGLPFLQGKAEFGEVYPSIKKYCSTPIRVANSNDVLLSVRAPVGPVNLAPTTLCVGRGLSAIRGKKETLDQMFLFFFMKLNEMKLAGNAVGSTFSSIAKGDIEKIKIPLPPLKTPSLQPASLPKSPTPVG